MARYTTTETNWYAEDGDIARFAQNLDKISLTLDRKGIAYDEEKSLPPHLRGMLCQIVSVHEYQCGDSSSLVRVGKYQFWVDTYSLEDHELSDEEARAEYQNAAQEFEEARAAIDIENQRKEVERKQRQEAGDRALLVRLLDKYGHPDSWTAQEDTK